MSNSNRYVIDELFKKRHSEKARKQMSDVILRRSETFIPVIVENSKSSDLHLSTIKYEPPKNHTVNDFIIDIKRQSGIPMKIEFGLYHSNSRLDSAKTIEYYYNKYRDSDGWLYLKQSTQYTWGKYLSTKLP